MDTCCWKGQLKKNEKLVSFKLGSLKLESFYLSLRVPSEIGKGRGLKLTPFLKSSPPITPFSSFYDDVIGHPDFRNESSRVDQPGTEDKSEVPYTLPGTNKKQ